MRIRTARLCAELTSVFFKLPSLTCKRHVYRPGHQRRQPWTVLGRRGRPRRRRRWRAGLGRDSSSSSSSDGGGDGGGRELLLLRSEFLVAFELSEDGDHPDLLNGRWRMTVVGLTGVNPRVSGAVVHAVVVEVEW